MLIGDTIASKTVIKEKSKSTSLPERGFYKLFYSAKLNV